MEAKLNFVQRAYFRNGLKRLHRLVRMRDNGQHYLVKLMLPVRHCYGLLAERWAERGWLAHAEDFFFLVTEEIAAVIAGRDAAGLPDRAAARRAAALPASRRRRRLAFGRLRPRVAQGSEELRSHPGAPSPGRGGAPP